MLHYELRQRWNNATIFPERRKSFHPSLPSPPMKVLNKYILSFSLSLFCFFRFFLFSFCLCLYSLCFSLIVCLSRWGCIPALGQRFLAFSCNWPASLSPSLLDNWACNPSPRLPIIASLQPPLPSIYSSSQR